MKSIMFIYLFFLFSLSCVSEKERQIYSDYETAIRAAKSEGKQLLIIFDTYSNPNNFIVSVLNNRKIKSRLDEYVVTRLFIEEKKNELLQRKYSPNFVQPTLYKIDIEKNLITDSLRYAQSDNISEFLLDNGVK